MRSLLLLLLPTAALAQTLPPVLDAGALADIDERLRALGLSREDVRAAPWGAPVPADAPAVVRDALDDPLSAPDLANQLATAVATDDAWGAVGTVWGAAAEDPCPEPPVLGTLSGRHVAHSMAQGERWPRRAVRDLEEKIDRTLDEQLGALLAEAGRARCRLDAALAPLGDDTRQALLAEVDAWLRDPTAAPTLAAAVQVNRPLLALAARDWSAAVAGAVEKLTLLGPERWPASPLIWQVEGGEVWVGSPGANAGAGDPMLLVDPGGDDHWRIRPDSEALATSGVRGWIDLGGDDVWRSGIGGAGSAVLGLGAGVDASGNDVHQGWALGAGSAVLGGATWLDLDGDDRYAIARAGLGFGAAGVGMLEDRDGSDVYTGQRSGQAAAVAGGIGVAHDARGDDSWLLTEAPSTGQAWAHGRAVALLVDGGGDDLYAAATDSQAAARAHGLAVLRDGGGDDRWSLTGGRQASADAGGVAVLLAPSGADAFIAGDGTNHILAGSGVAWLIHRSAPKEEAIFGPTAAWSAPRPWPWNAFLAVVDLGGPGPEVTTSRHNGSVLLLPFAPGPTSRAFVTGSSIPAAVAELNTLRKEAWRDPARAGEFALRAEELSASDDPQVRAAAWHARAVLPQIPGLSVDPADAEAIATEAAVLQEREPDPDVRAAALGAAGHLGGAGVASTLTRALLEGEPSVRDAAEQALYALLDRVDGVAVARGLYPVATGDEAAPPAVRDAALRVLGATRERDAVPVLVDALAEEHELTQRNAAEGLLRHGSRAAEQAVRAWLDEHPAEEGWAESIRAERE